MTHEEIVQRVNRALLAEFDVDEEKLQPEARLGEDLDLDSLDGIDLVVALEKEFKEFGVKVAEKQARELRTLQNIYDYVAAAIPK